MSNISLDSHALEQLHKEQKALLDTIDSLRKHGVDRFVDLPQIICVGDQSSGKSSVLEAISRVRFPVRDGLCTRFATELVLRTDSRTKVDVQIQSPSSSGKDAHSFNKTSFAKDDLPEIIEEAKQTMLQDGAAFSEDVLRVEICGPDVPHLTLVDLPGFYHSESESQSAAGREIVDALAERYMSRKNSIILAVISARNQIILQKVLSKVKIHDKNRERTLGIITKPDLVKSGSQDEQDFVQLAKNLDKSHTLSLGWHVLRNRGDNEQGSDQERDDEEKRFFAANAAWTSVPSKNRGIEVLRSKLSSILLGHIKSHIHSLVSGIEREMAAREARLKRLGDPRSTAKELRAYLDRIASQFQILSLNAIDGNYSHEFFGGLFPDSEDINIIDSRTPKLRALVRDLNRAFTHVLATKGSTRIILPQETIVNDGKEESVDGDDSDKSEATETLTSDVLLPLYLRRLVGYYSFKEPQVMSFKAAAAILETQSADNQGTEFPGTSNDRLAIEFFRHQSQPWEAIAKAHIELMLSIAKSFVERLLDHIAGANSKAYSVILTDIVDPFFHHKEVALQVKLKELLHHYRKGNPQPLDAEFRELLANRNRKAAANEVLLQLIRTQPELFTDAGRAKIMRNRKPRQRNEFDASGLIHKAEAYYEIALRTFTENTIVLAIENCLIEDIPNLFTTERVNRMEDEELESLAAESEEVRIERAELRDEYESLEKGLKICNKYRDRKPTSVTFVQPVHDHIRPVLTTRTPSTPPAILPNKEQTGSRSGKPKQQGNLFGPSSIASSNSIFTPPTSTKTSPSNASSKTPSGGSFVPGQPRHNQIPLFNLPAKTSENPFAKFLDTSRPADVGKPQEKCKAHEDRKAFVDIIPPPKGNVKLPHFHDVSPSETIALQHISATPFYANFSPEEIRLAAQFAKMTL